MSLVQAYDGTRFYGWASAIGVEKIMPNRQFPENAADGHYVAEGHYVYAAQGRNVAVMLSLPTSGQMEQKL